MKKTTFLLLLIFLNCNFLFSQQEVKEIKKIYSQAKSSFLYYEKAHGNYVETDNVKMHYLTWGNSKDIPLIWIHGTFSNSYELLDIIDSLVRQNLYVIAIDYYGHGLTSVPSKEVSLYHVADDIAFLMNKLNLDKAIIGGWSRGGSIATAFYDAYPSKVIGLILEDGGSVAWDEPNHKEQIRDYEKDINKYFETYTEPTIYTSELDAYSSIFKKYKIINKSDLKSNKRDLFTRIANLQMLESNKFQFNSLVEKIICEDSSENYLDVVHRTFQAKTLFGMSSHLLFPKIIYRNLNLPVLIFDPISDNDWFEFSKENKELKDTHPNLITLKIYQNTGHGVKHEHSDKFIKDVLAFIEEIKK